EAATDHKNEKQDRAHRQQRLRAIERLNLEFLIDAEDDGTLGRRQVEADNIAHLLHEQRIGRELEGFDAMRLQAEGAPDSMHRRRGMADLLGHAPQAPVRTALGTRLERLADRRSDLVVADFARRARAWPGVET